MSKALQELVDPLDRTKPPGPKKPGRPARLSDEQQLQEARLAEARAVAQRKTIENRMAGKRRADEMRSYKFSAALCWPKPQRTRYRKRSCPQSSRIYPKTKRRYSLDSAFGCRTSILQRLRRRHYHQHRRAPRTTWRSPLSTWFLTPHVLNRPRKPPFCQRMTTPQPSMRKLPHLKALIRRQHRSPYNLISRLHGTRQSLLLAINQVRRKAHDHIPVRRH